MKVMIIETLALIGGLPSDANRRLLPEIVNTARKRS
jgi:hypothetical protein